MPDLVAKLVIQPPRYGIDDWDEMLMARDKVLTGHFRGQSVCHLIYHVKLSQPNTLPRQTLLRLVLPTEIHTLRTSFSLSEFSDSHHFPLRTLEIIGVQGYASNHIC